MRSPSRRPAAPLLAALLGALLAACGATGQASHPPPHPPGLATLRGSLLQVNGTRLTVRDGIGPDTTQVTFAPMATPIYAVTSVTTSAIQPGSCVSVRGERDATGTVAATVMVVATSVDDACPATSEPPPPPAADPSPTPLLPSTRGSPSSASLPGPALIQGQVLSLGGAAAAVQGPQGDPLVVLMPPNVQVLFFEPSGRGALVIPSCVVVQGTRSGHTMAAHRIVDWPPGTEC